MFSLNMLSGNINLIIISKNAKHLQNNYVSFIHGKYNAFYANLPASF